MRPGKDDNDKNFDRRFIKRHAAPVPMPMTQHSTGALGPAQTVQATLQSTVPQNGSSAAFNARGGLFVSAFNGGFFERADALISIGGPGMHVGGSRRWTSEAAAELAKVTKLGDIAHLDANSEEKYAGMMDSFRCRNLFPARKKEESEYDLDPRDLNRRFEEEARAAKRAEKLLAVEKLLAKEQPATHYSLPARKTYLYMYSMDSSRESKEFKESKEPAKRAKTWPGRNLFTAKKENEDPNVGESHKNPYKESLKTLARRLTGTGKDW